MAVAKKVLVAAKSEYIDPTNCDSTVSFKIVRRGRTHSTWGSIQLADCLRKIEWYFSQDTPVNKIDKAISVMEEFRSALIASRKDTPVPKRKAKKT